MYTIMYGESIISMKSEDKVSIPLGKIIQTKAPERYCLYGIGTCLCIYIYDRFFERFLIAHTVLPFQNNNTNNYQMPAKFTDSAIEFMYDNLISTGSVAMNIHCKIVGGATIYNKEMNIGENNIKSAQKMCHKLGIKIDNEDIGGLVGRSIIEFHQNGEILVRKAGKLYRI